MNVVVTGASGFIGSYLVRHLVESGDEVIAIGGPDRPLPEIQGPEWRTVDLFDTRRLGEILASHGPSVIYHLAGWAELGASFADPIGPFKVNVMGTASLVDVMLNASPSARLVNISSAAVYGILSADEIPVSADRPPAPVSPYGASKLAQEIVAEYGMRRGLDLVTLRLFNHMGPGQKRGYVTADFASQIVSGGTMKTGDLSRRRDFLDVRDAVRAYRLAARKGRSGGIYHIASGVSRSLEEIIDLMAAAAGVRPDIRRDGKLDRPADVPEIRGDITGTTGDLGWSPEIPIERTIGDIMEYWRRIDG